MLSSFPRSYQIKIRATLSSAWLLVGVGGVAAVFRSPFTIVSELGTIVVYIWGAVTAVAAIVAMLGVALNRYRLEWAAAWFAAAGLSVYMATLWWLVFSGETTRLTQASIVSASVLFMVTRALTCAAHAAKLRAFHIEETGEVDVPR